MVDVGSADRGPLLLISGQEDLLVPDAVMRAVYKQNSDSTAVTDLKEFIDRAHFSVIGNGWRYVADYVLGWLDERGLRAYPSQGATRRRNLSGTVTRSGLASGDIPALCHHVRFED
ncbi:hypothetical protein ACIQB5_46030 [Streptomyces sp. NPDC088560]|uniref:hypothetical protein n=1 Tax=Streptomyces sp. NPDC088560 TaxID=3365868 RepID=UPI003824AF13